MSKFYKVEDFQSLQNKVRAGMEEVSKYNWIFSESRVHGCWNTPAAKEIISKAAGKLPALSTRGIEPFAVGGSDLGAIHGVDPWKSKYKLQKLKLGIWKDKVDERKQEIFDYGHNFEEATGRQCVQILSNRTGKDFRFIGDEDGYWTPEYPHFLAHPDGKILVDGKKYLAEVKTCNPFGNHWKDYFKNNAVPPTYMCQIQAYMHILNYEGCYVLVYNTNGTSAEKNFAQIFVEYDEDFAKEVLEEAEAFVDDTVNGIMYTTSDIEDEKLLESEMAEAYPATDPTKGYVEISSLRAPAFDRLNLLEDEEQALKDAIEPIKRKYEEDIKAELKRLKEIEKERGCILASFMEEIEDAPGGVFEDSYSNYQIDVEKKSSFDSSVKGYFEEKYPAVWNDVMSRKVSIKQTFKRTLKES